MTPGVSRVGRHLRQRSSPHATQIFQIRLERCRARDAQGEAGTLKSGRSGKTVKSRKQAIAIGLSEARKKGKKVPKKKAS